LPYFRPDGRKRHTGETNVLANRGEEQKLEFEEWNVIGSRGFKGFEGQPSSTKTMVQTISLRSMEMMGIYQIVEWDDSRQVLGWEQ
jgi:hypothetical protein